jgi:hypothetical protein
MSAVRADLRESYYCAAEVIKRRRDLGHPTPGWLRQHYAKLDAEIRDLSDSGHELPRDRGQLEEGN